MRKHIFIVGLSVFCLVFTQMIFAESAAELAAESEAYCVSTRKESPTSPDLIVSKVAEACKLLQKEGTPAFIKFKGKGSPFIFDGTYMWIHSIKESTMLQHPIKYKMEGKNLVGLKDTKGKRLFVVMTRVVREKGAGWVDYMWPIPGTKDSMRKITYVKGCTTADGVEVLIGCGIYNYKKEDLDKLDIN